MNSAAGRWSKSVIAATLMGVFFAMTAFAQTIQPLANAYVTVFASPDPARVYTYSPGLARLDSGRLIATFDLGGPGLATWAGVKGRRYGQPVQGQLWSSDDGGQTWVHRVDFPFMQARPFTAGGALYVLGQAGDLQVIRSADQGSTWSAPALLTTGQDWTQAPANVHLANGCIYLVMNQRPYPHRGIWPVCVEAPVLLRGRVDDDLTRRENWTFASLLAFRDVASPASFELLGVPFYPAEPDRAVPLGNGRNMDPIGWLETHVVQFPDPDHLWHDPTNRTFYLWSRAHTGSTGLAAIAKVTEQGERAGTGAMLTSLVTAPSGKPMLYVPCPGGQMKFHVLYDSASRLYWLLSTQATDSMVRPDRLPAGRYGLPNNERRRLQLSFSRNMIDWCFAGLVAVGPVEKASRHYATMVVDGADLVILSRSGDEGAHNAHDGNLITCHRVRGFRALVY